MRRGLRLLLAGAALVAWGCASVSAGSGPAVADPVARPGASHARRILVRRCQNCHALPNPAKFQRAAWEQKLGLMERKVRLAAADWDSLRSLVPAAVDSAAAGDRP